MCFFDGRIIIEVGGKTLCFDGSASGTSSIPPEGFLPRNNPLMRDTSHVYSSLILIVVFALMLLDFDVVITGDTGGNHPTLLFVLWVAFYSFFKTTDFLAAWANHTFTSIE